MTWALLGALYLGAGLGVGAVSCFIRLAEQQPWESDWDHVDSWILVLIVLLWPLHLWRMLLDLRGDR